MSKPFFQHAAPGFSGAKSSLYLKFNGDVKLHKGLTFAGWQSVRESYFECIEAGCVTNIVSSRSKYEQCHEDVVPLTEQTCFQQSKVNVTLFKAA